MRATTMRGVMPRPPAISMRWNFLLPVVPVVLALCAAGPGTSARAAGGPATSPVSSGGVVEVRTVQRTPGGTAPAGSAVYVDVLVGKQISRQEAKLDDAGRATVEGLPLPCRPLVTVVHQGVEYRAMGAPMDAANPRQTVEVGVYDSTAEEPAWSVKMRHVLLRAGRDGVQVTEVLAVENPADRSWTGRNDASGRPVTLEIRLPDGASEVKVGGAFDECCTELAEGVLKSRSAIVPGVTQYHVQYELAARGGRVDFQLRAPAPVRQTMLMAADDGTTVESAELMPVSDAEMSGRGMRLFSAGPVDKGRTMSVHVARLDALRKGESRQAGADGGTALKLVAGFAAGAVLLAGILGVFLKGSRQAGPNQNER